MIGDGYQQLTDPGFTFDPNDPRDYATQYYAWQLTKDTLICDITTSWLARRTRHRATDPCGAHQAWATIAVVPPTRRLGATPAQP